MPAPYTEQAVLRLVDKAEIWDAMCRYARAVDRSDWAGVRASYHPDAWDDHGEYKGDIDGLIEWLAARFAGAENGMHFLGNCLIEFAGPDLAMVETYFISQRLRAPSAEERKSADPQDAICRQGWGRYLDLFECREGHWRVVRRTVVLDSAFTFIARGGGLRPQPIEWGKRGRDDLVYLYRGEILGLGDG